MPPAAAAAHAPPWWTTFAAAGLGASIAEVCTLPVDTAKVRLQLLRRAAAGAAGAPPPALGMLGMVRAIARAEGVPALFAGLAPALHRQLVNASLRVGLYGQISALLAPPGGGDVPLASKVLAGLASGAVGIAVANPTDLVKVRMQSDGARAAGAPRRYAGVFDAYATIVRTEGVRGLWTGLGPAVARNSIINAAELATYDEVKQRLRRGPAGWGDHFGTHVTAAAAAGAVATLVGNPVDVVKTRVMAARSAAAGGAPPPPGAPPPYTGALDCAMRTLAAEGPRAFYQGVVPQFYRITGWNVVMFVAFEQIKALMVGTGR